MGFRFRQGLVAALTAVMALASSAALAAPKPSFTLAGASDVGASPWSFAAESGILRRWADKYGIAITLEQSGGRVEALQRYATGRADAVIASNLDCLTVPAVAGIDSTAIILNDYSDGGDAIILKSAGIAPKKKRLADLAGQTVTLDPSPSARYLLARALDQAGLRATDVTLGTVAESAIVDDFGRPDVTALAVSAPETAAFANSRNAQTVFDSSAIPGEIIEMTLVKSEVLASHPELARALAGAWYEVMGLMSRKGAAGEAVLARMAEAHGSDPDAFATALTATHLVYDPADAARWARGSDIVAAMERVRRFAADPAVGGAARAEAIGIGLPGGEVLGDRDRIGLRVSADVMELAAAHRL